MPLSHPLCRNHLPGAVSGTDSHVNRRHYLGSLPRRLRLASAAHRRKTNSSFIRSGLHGGGLAPAAPGGCTRRTATGTAPGTMDHSQGPRRGLRTTDRGPYRGPKTEPKDRGPWDTVHGSAELDDHRLNRLDHRTQITDHGSRIIKRESLTLDHRPLTTDR